MNDQHKNPLNMDMFNQKTVDLSDSVTAQFTGINYAISNKSHSAPAIYLEDDEIQKLVDFREEIKNADN